MTTDWNNAPRWANWIAMDKNGECYWFEYEPIKENDHWFPNGGSHGLALSERLPHWSDSLESRPIAGSNNEDLEAKIKRYEEALRYYADGLHWEVLCGGEEVVRDYGDTARRALEGSK